MSSSDRGKFKWRKSTSRKCDMSKKLKRMKEDSQRALDKIERHKQGQKQQKKF